MQELVEEHMRDLFRLWLLPESSWAPAARSAALQHLPCSWPSVRPLVLAALDTVDARAAIHFLPELSSVLSAAALHCQTCIQAAAQASMEAQRALEGIEAAVPGGTDGKEGGQRGTDSEEFPEATMHAKPDVHRDVDAAEESIEVAADLQEGAQECEESLQGALRGGMDAEGSLLGRARTAEKFREGQEAQEAPRASVPLESVGMLSAVVEQSAQSGISTFLQAVTEIIRRIPHRFAALRRRNVLFLDDSFMFLRQVITATVRYKALSHTFALCAVCHELMLCVSEHSVPP
jgi:hypothetical protein